MQPQRTQQLDNSVTKQRGGGRLGGLVAALIILVIAAGLALYRQSIQDYFIAQSFQPSSALQQVLDRTYLSEKGRFYVYASQTEVVDRSGFNEACGGLQNEKTVVLGCYTSALKRIYVYDVSDTRLAGVRESTTAHEMLHAAYERLGGAERQRIAELLDQQAEQVTDERLLQLIAFYKESEPTQLTTELHSIFGTELMQLNPELDAYYAQYFSDRTALVAQQQAYERVFTDLRNQQDSLVQQMQEIAGEVDQREQAYLAQLTRLNADIAQFNSWVKRETTTRAEFDSRRLALEKRIVTMENERQAINQLIDAYNGKRAELEELNVLAEDLQRSIDSKREALPSTPVI